MTVRKVKDFFHRSVENHVAQIFIISIDIDRSIDLAKIHRLLINSIEVWLRQASDFDSELHKLYRKGDKSRSSLSDRQF